MLNADILVQIFELCDLEMCVSLGQVCSFNYSLFHKLDDLLRKKVQKRVPWFTLDNSESTWPKCAILTVSRTKRGLDPSRKNLYLLKDLKVAVSLGANKVTSGFCVDLQSNEETRKDMKPLFETQLGDEEVTQGSKLLTPGLALDLRTMKTESTDYDGEDTFDHSTCPNEAVSASGLVIRNAFSSGFLRIIDENDNLVHIRLLTKEGVKDTLVCNRNKGVSLCTAQPLGWKPPKRDAPNTIDGTIVSLLPGSGGALVATTSTEDDTCRQMVYYVDPFSLDLTLICTVPYSLTYKNAYSEFKTQFYTTFDGYLFVYFAGRFFRLWVDLGYRSELLLDKPKMFIDQILGPVLNRCLTVWDRDFPVIGTFDGDAKISPFRISRGKQMGRFVTVGGASGRMVGDLATGRTYFSPGDGITVPFFNETLSFGKLSPQVSSSLIKRLEEAEVGVDLSKDFQEYCAEFKNDVPKQGAKVVKHLRTRNSFRNDNRDLEQEYPWIDKEPKGEDEDEDEEYESSESDPDEESELREREAREAWYRHHRDAPLSDDDDESDDEPYDDYDECYARPVVYKDIFRQMPTVELNPSTMNAAKAFKRAEET